ncbi:hypothetical protein QLQ80_01020 [Mycoplasma sp. M5725]|uniref:LIPOPROTEIN n=1 Tax=Mycoplasma phocimorsus TaxID=3045839 RepID=A0AAJ1UZF3_9MOLU|nr:aromatic motif membrane protein [Mycoplasma phocimorsus]MDJ1645673.1 hypothetical protein [Mycoplasma phocimorsus]
MKKLLNLKLLTLISTFFITPTIVLSCSNSSKNIEKETYGNQLLDQLVKIHVNFKANTPSEIKESELLAKKYINNQDSISETKFQELDYALSFFAPFNLENQSRVDDDFSRIFGKSHQLVLDLFKSNWYWYLKHLNRMIFNFNPYSDRYTDIPKSKSKIDINNVIEKLFETNKLIIQPKNNIKNLISHYSYNWNDFEKENSSEFLLSKNKYNIANHEIGLTSHYLQIEKDLYLRFWTYVDKHNVSKIVMLPDLFLIPNSDEQTIKNFEKEIFLTRIENIAKRMEYQKEAEIFEEEIFEKEANDFHLLKLFERHSYNEFVYNTLLKVNADGMKVYRYTFRGVNNES